MKKFLLYAFTALLTVLCCAGCNKNSDSGSKTPPVPDDFTFEVTELTQGSFGLNIQPEDAAQTYYFNLVTKEDFGQYETGEALQQADLLYFTELAASVGLPLDQFLQEALLKGPQSKVYEALTPETAYVFYCYGISAAGEALTEVNSYEFSTPAVEFMNVNFAISATDITDTSFTLNIQPDNDQCYYYYDAMPASTYEEYCANDPANIPAFMESYLEILKDEMFPDYTMPQFVRAITQRGAHTDSESFTLLLPEYTYYAFAIGIANDGTLMTAASVTPVTTTESPKNEYTVNSEKVDDVSYSAYITASQSEAFAVLLERQCYFSETDSDADIINALYTANGNDFSNNLYADHASVEFKRLIPDEAYYLFVFACNADGSPKLDEGKINLLKVPVKTETAAMSSARFTLSAHNIEKTTATIKVNAESQYSEETFVFTYMTRTDYDNLASKVGYFYDTIDEALREKMDEFLDESLEEWNASHSDAQMDMKEFLSRALMDGAGELSYYDITDLEPGTSYVVYLFGMKADKTYTTSAVTTEFTTVSDQSCLAYMEFYPRAYDYEDRNETLYQIWCYAEGSYARFYAKAFNETDEWAGKSVDEIRGLLQNELVMTASGTACPCYAKWGTTFYFYAVCYDTQDFPSDVYKIVYTAPETGEGFGLKGGDVTMEVTTVSDSAAASVLAVKETTGLTGPVVAARREPSAPLKYLTPEELDKAMTRKFTHDGGIR